MKAIEVEYKFLVKDKFKLTELIERLSDLGKPKFERQYQSNVMFDNPDQLMQKTDGRIRVRILGKDGKKVLTYKKPLPPKLGAKREIEYEVEVGDSRGHLEQILAEMEFLPVSSYERYQTKWHIADTLITLDEYPYACFIELEGRLSDIKKLSQTLGFIITDGLTKPADTLFQEWRKRHGLSFKPHMHFDDYDK